MQKQFKCLAIGIVAVFAILRTDTAHAGHENGFWIDNNRLIAETMSSSVELGVDFIGRYVAIAGARRYTFSSSTNGLGYKVNYAGSGRTQWVSFEFIGSNFFGNGFNTSPAIQGGNHLIIFLRGRTFQDSSTIYDAEGKGIFFGKNHGSWGGCGLPEDKARIFFETRLVNSAVASPGQSGGAVKCADGFSDKYLEDGVKYSVSMHVNDTHIAYWIYRADQVGNMVLWSSNGTNALDYPPTFFNSGLLNAPWLWNEYPRMNNGNIDTLSIGLAGVQMGIGAWNLKITNLNSGRF